MLYEFDVTVTADTAEASPVEAYLDLTAGIIQRLDIQFPIGCGGMVFCRLENRNFGQLPTNRDGSFQTDGYIISIASPIEFTVEPFIIKFLGWSPGTTYDHVITVRVDMADSRLELWMISIFKGLEKLLKLMKIKV